MARQEKIFYDGVTINNVVALQRTCRTEESNFETFKLISLEAVTSSGRKGTEAVYEEVEDGSTIKTLTIKQSPETANGKTKQFDGTAFVLTVNTNVSVFR